MSKRAEKKQQDEAKILECLESGPQTTATIAEVVSCSVRTANDKLNSLMRDGKVKREKRGIYSRIKASEPKEVALINVRKEIANQETINRFLNLYDKLLDVVAVSIEKEDWDAIMEKIETIKSLRWLGSTVDQLMKRWYLVHRGYDTNTRQAVEDAKEKTSEREKQELENAPLEDQMTEVAHFHSDLKKLWDKLPEPEKKSKTV